VKRACNGATANLHTCAIALGIQRIAAIAALPLADCRGIAAGLPSTISQLWFPIKEGMHRAH
jgi:hypothetical protein